jgi:5-methyltetrahydrofolate--homocysteine methyltransferase
MTPRETFLAEAKKRILLTDGAWGTQIQNFRLVEADYAGDLGLSHDQKGNNDILALTRVDVVEKIARAYFDAGSDIISTNTFSSNLISQADYGAEHLVRDLNIANAQINRRIADEYAAKDGRPRFVVGAIGPTNKTLSLSPDVNDPGFREITFDYLKDVYRDQVDALVDGGVDFILIETVFDTLNAKAAVMAVLEAQDALGRDLPMMISMTLTDLSGRNLSGHTVEAFWYAVRHAKPLTIGLNCSFGAEQLRPHVKVLSGIADTLIMIYPNAGLPNDLGDYDELPAQTAALVREWADAGQVNILGGCCGSSPAHISAMARSVAGLAPRSVTPPPVATRLAGLEPMTLAA